MKLYNDDIRLIEKAFGFKLYRWQIDYLKGITKELHSERRMGRTTAYIIDLLLNSETEIDIKRDAKGLRDNSSKHYTDTFFRMMTDINNKLESVGFETKVVKPKPKPSNSFSIKLDADTTNLSLKLKAIAKHAESLANELDMIDKLSEEQ